MGNLQTKWASVQAVAWQAPEALDQKIDQIPIEEELTVVNCAGRAHQGSAVTEHQMELANAKLPAAWGAIALKHPRARFIHISSSKVLGDQTPYPLSETAQVNPQDAYARSKLAGETALLQAFSAHPERLLIIRPPLIYGPNAHANFGRLVRIAQSSLPLPLSNATALRSLISRNNLLAAVQWLAQSKQHGVFHVADEKDYSTAELIRTIRTRLNRNPRLFSVPESWVKKGTQCIGKPGIYQRLFQPLQLDCKKLQSTGFTPAESFVDSLTEILPSR